MCVIFVPQCFDSVDWVTGRACPDHKIRVSIVYPKVLFYNLW